MAMKIFMGANKVRDGELAAPKGKKGKVNLINLRYYFCPPGSGSGFAFWMRIRLRIQLKLRRIHADPDPQPWPKWCRSGPTGSTTLLTEAVTWLSQAAVIFPKQTSLSLSWRMRRWWPGPIRSLSRLATKDLPFPVHVATVSNNIRYLFIYIEGLCYLVPSVTLPPLPSPPSPPPPLAS